MKTISQNLPNEFSLRYESKSYSLRAMNWPDDFDLLYHWMHQEHVITQWQLNKSKLDLEVHFEKMIVDDHQKLYIISVDGKDVGYTELYECYRDRISLYYPAKKHDMGMHLLIGDKAYLGKGHFEPIILIIIQNIFSHCSECEYIIAEPDYKIRLFHRYTKRFGYKLDSKVKLPEKEASLFKLNINDYFDSIAFKSWWNKVNLEEGVI